MGELQPDLGIHKNDMTCLCLPSCNSIHYDAEILNTVFDVNNYVNQFEKLYNVSYGLAFIQ